MVLCCMCGVELGQGFSAAGGARCTHCLQREVNITEGIGRRVHIQRCNNCFRYQKPPWVDCEPESRELLAVCLRHVKGITREHNLVDACFLWTEPHSKELKVKLTLQMEAIAGVVVEQQCVVDFRVDDQQCLDCQRSFTRHTWESSVQVRQRAEHRRTLLNLEQLILKHKAHRQLLGLEKTKDGIDFFFNKQSDAAAFVAFLKTWAVLKHNESKHLVSHNANNTTYRFKRTTCVELCPICRDDLVFLPPKTRQALGGCPPLMLCSRASSTLGLVDPSTMRSVELSSAEFWKRSFKTLCSTAQLTEFIVLDVTPDDSTARPCSKNSNATSARRRLVPCDIEVARMADFGQNDERLIVRSHLGAALHPGDTALGYDLRSLNMAMDENEMGLVPPLEVYLVRKKKDTDKMNKKRKSRYLGAKRAEADGNDAKASEAVTADRNLDTASQLGQVELDVAAGDLESEGDDEDDEEAGAVNAATDQLFRALESAGKAPDRSTALSADAHADAEADTNVHVAHVGVASPAHPDAIVSDAVVAAEFQSNGLESDCTPAVSTRTHASTVDAGARSDSDDVHGDGRRRKGVQGGRASARREKRVGKGRQR